MAYSRERTTKDGRRFYEITVSRGRSAARITRRWYPPDGWSARAIERQLEKEEAALEAAVASGKITTRKEAKAAEIEAAAARATGRTVAQYADEVFLPRGRSDHAPTTAHEYAKRLRLYILPALGALRLVDVTPADVSALLFSLRDAGISLSTVSAVRVTLAAMFSAAVDDGTIAASPVRKARRPRRQKDDPPPAPDVLTQADVEALLRQLEAEPPHYAALVRLLLETGLRIDEALALSAADVQPDNRIIINKGAHFAPEKGHYIGATKTGRARTVYVSQTTAEALRKLSEDHGGGFCFSVDGSRPLAYGSVNQYIRRLAARAGVPQLHAHALRHTFATAAITAGVDVARVAAALGHASPLLTLYTYTHASAADAQRAAEAARAALFPVAAEDQKKAP